MYIYIYIHIQLQSYMYVCLFGPSRSDAAAAAQPGATGVARQVRTFIIIIIITNMIII